MAAGNLNRYEVLGGIVEIVFSGLIDNSQVTFPSGSAIGKNLINLPQFQIF